MCLTTAGVASGVLLDAFVTFLPPWCIAANCGGCGGSARCLPAHLRHPPGSSPPDAARGGADGGSTAADCRRGGGGGWSLEAEGDEVPWLFELLHNIFASLHLCTTSPLDEVTVAEPVTGQSSEERMAAAVLSRPQLATSH